MEWLQIVIDQNKKVLAQMAEVQKDQKNLLAIALDNHHRSKRNEEVLATNTKDMENHIARTDHIQDVVEHIVQILEWFKATGKIIKWVGVLASVVMALWGVYALIKGL